ncbi:MAG: hypothetical protein L0322_25845 [Chloroflexi bacterium]|nr:hypothetical protein [Chloroflexota bacterium]MCI0644264.1 hypothetical protein [Chloroflexota bacterium]
MKSQRVISFAVCLIATLLAAGTSRAGQPRPDGVEWRPGRSLYGGPEDIPHLDGGRVQQPEPSPYSPDIIPWSTVVFQSYRDNNWEIYSGNDTGTSQTRLTNQIFQDIDPNFNRGATRIVFASDREGAGDYDLYTMNAGGSGVAQLTFNAGDDWNPEWSPDGTRIAFQSEVNSQSDVFVVNADGSGLTQLTFDPDYDGAPAWSPDGTKLAFVSRRTGGYRVYVMNADGSNQTQLSDQAYSNNPAWSPNGRQIAFDADGNSNNWQEVWVMNADGSGEQALYAPNDGTIDYWVSGWSPDGQFITFTQIFFLYFQGNWYWTAAYLKALVATNPLSQVFLSPNNRDWDSHWQTTEIQPPQSGVQPLPAQSPTPISVSWSGSDAGPAGLRMFDVQVRQGSSGPWTDWLVQTTGTSGAYANGVGGQTYYFRSRAWDNAHNVEPWPAGPDASTTVEALPPMSAVSLLPAYTRKGSGILVNWGGFDFGGSGIASYDVQSRLGNGSWTNWRSNTTSLTGLFTGGNSGQTIYFQTRARDRAQNLESWPGGNGDTQTTLYTWGARGVVYDNGHAPVVGATPSTSPAALGVLPSDLAGLFGAFVSASASNYNLNLGKSGYGTLPAASFPAIYDANVEMILPPADDVIANGGFESGGLGSWAPAGGLPITVTTAAGHTGQYHLRVGTIPTQWAGQYSVASANDYSKHIITPADGRVHLLWGNYNGLYYRSRAINGTWSATQVVGSTAVGVGSSTTVLDQQGVLHVAWVTFDEEILYARRNVDGTWSGPQTVAQGSISVGNPQLAVDNLGQAHLVWPDKNSEYYAEYVMIYSRRLPNGTWTAPAYVSEVSSLSLWYFSLAVDGNGRLHLVWPWDRGYGNPAPLLYVQSPGNGLWTGPAFVSGSGDMTATPVLVHNGNDSMYLVWDVSNNNSTDGIYFRQWDEHLGWSDIQRVSSQNGPVEDVAVSSDGAMSVVWYGNAGIYHARRDAEGYWSPHQQVGSYSYLVGGIQVALDAGDRPHLLWALDEYLGYAQVLYSRQLPNGNWTTPEELANNEFEFHSPQLAFDSGNVLHLIYSGYTDGFYYRGPVMSQNTGTAAVSQVVTVPVTMTTPLLSFMYQLSGAYGSNGGSPLVVRVDDGATITAIATLDEATGERWTHGWSDLSAWAGQTVTVTFTLQQAAGAPTAWARVDEVTLGTGHPDLWVTLGDGLGLPGEEITLTLTYGNQGGVPASGVHITQTLPAGLNFVSASLPPISTAPLVWDVGSLPAGSGPLTILVRVQVAPAAPPLTTLTSPVTIAPTGPELETANNDGEGHVFVGRRLYLPVILKN